MASVKMDLKTAKLSLKVSKVGLTKAISEFERVGEQFEKNKDAAVARSRKVRLAATLIEALDTINLKVKKMTESKDTCVGVIIGINDDDLSKPKEFLQGPQVDNTTQSFQQLQEQWRRYSNHKVI